MKKKKTVPLKRTKTIAFITEAIMSSVKNDYLHGFAEYAQRQKDIAVRCIEPVHVGKSGILDGCDGIVTDTADNAVLEYFKTTGLPIVYIGDSDDPAIVGVKFDSVTAATMAAEWFLRRGFRNFAYCGVRGISGALIYDPSEKAFADAVAKAGCECMVFDEAALTKRKYGKHHLKNLLKALDIWIPTLPPRTAMLCTHDLRAQNVVNTCLRLGRQVPDDIAVMGRFNDVALCMCAPVAMSSIDMNLRGVGYAAMRILANAIDNPVKPKLRPTFLVPPAGIVERTSSNTYPVDPPYLAKAMLLLDEKIGSPVTAPKLAAEVGVPAPTLRAAFKRVLKTSLGKYALSIRMREAKRLIDEKRLSIKEITAATGFATQSHFCNTYRAHFGSPPARNRR